jgi:hypothetical protein
MDAQTIDQEYAKLQSEFQDAAKSVQDLAGKMQAAGQAGDANATAWLADLKTIAQDISDEQAQANTVLQAIHAFVSAAVEEKPPLYAPGHEPQAQPQQQQQPMQQGGMLGGMMGGGMGHPFGGFLNGGFGQAMMMGGGIGLGQSLIGSLFRL